MVGPWIQSYKDILGVNLVTIFVKLDPNGTMK
jgi:hypothetical protein